jgi:hypothetical protein
MAKQVRKPRTKKVDIKDIESAEELPREEKIKKTSYNDASEDFLRNHGLLR